MAYIIRAVFAFWFGTLLSLNFAGVKTTRKNIWKVLVFFVIAMGLQTASSYIGGGDTAERLYPLTTHLPLVIWMIALYKIKWEIAFGAVLTAYLCCELPYWVSSVGAIIFDSNYNIEVSIYCISSVLILHYLVKHIAPSLLGLFSENRKVCFTFSMIPALYYIWCYSATVYTSYLKENGYQVALTMSAMFTLLFLISSIAQHKKQEDERMLAIIMQQKQAEEAEKQEAIRVSKAKGDFLASMSHEIRTPINAVLGIDEMILRECNDPLVLDYASKIKIAGQSLLYLINDILDLSKIESEHMELNLMEYNPQKLIAEVLLMIEPRIQAKGLELKYDIDENIPRKLLGDDMRIRQILINILTNAVKYTDEGSVTLKVGVLSRSEEAAVLHVSVKDTGIGIKDEDRDSMFESFRRVDLARNKSIEGTGLGLSITLKLLKLMNSDLKLESVYGEGSDFYFYLPQKIVDPEGIGIYQDGFHNVAVADTYRERFMAPEAKILVVDDSDLNLLVFKGLLKNSGMDIRTVMSGQEAIEAVYKEKFDMVFMDHLMPKMDGVEALKFILSDVNLAENAGTIIALTANAVVGAEEEYLKAGFHGYLKKPISGEELEKIIRMHLPADKVKELIIEERANEADLGEKLNEQKNEQEDEQIIDQSVGLQVCAGDWDFYREIMEAFVYSKFIDLINERRASENWNAYRITIHGIKSGAKSIGAMKLAKLAESSELALKEREDVDFVMEHHEEVIREIKKVEEAIAKLLDK